MRLTWQLLKKHSSLPLEEVEYLDLSGQEIVAIERLNPCCRLQTLVLCNNNIDVIRNIDCCRQLWKIDLTGNRVKSLHGFSRFPILGTLVLAYNDLDWQELRRLCHMHLLSLTLVGNNKLDSDTHYREHVLDLLPHLWMLDGRIITAEERRDVQRFFSTSEASLQPVRRKGTEGVFVPTSMKNLLVTGIYGEKTAHMMSQFPVKYVHTVEMDKKRLQYLAFTLEEEMKLVNSYKQNIAQKVPELVKLIEHREAEVEQCNMLLLLLLASLEYSIPFDVMRATLETAKLTKIGEVDCVELFSLPSHVMLEIASLLISAAAVDREEKKDGGLYEQLFRSLCYTLEKSQRKISSQKTKRPVTRARKLSAVEEALTVKLRCLLASEVVHLMCLVPLFFESLESSKGLMEVIIVATKNPRVSDIIGSIAWTVQKKGGDVWEVYHDIASYLLQSTSKNVLGKKRTHLREYKRSSSPVHRTSSQMLQSTQPKFHVSPTRALSAGAIGTRTTQVAIRRGFRTPELGDFVMVDSERVARIVALPENNVAVLQLNPMSPSRSSPPDSYFYTDTQGLVWDRKLRCWSKDDLTAELSTGRLNSYPDCPISTVSLEARTVTPGLSTTRPHSQLSYYSDDLSTIPSQDELTEDDSPSEQPPMRVDISDRPGSIKSVATKSAILSQGELENAKVGHQRHVLQQYTVNQDKQTEAKPSAEDKVPLATSTPEQSPPAVQESTFTVPTPQVHLLDTWVSTKSLPASAFTRPHSCQQSEKQLPRTDSGLSPTHGIHTPPTSPTSPTRPPSSSLSLKSTSVVSPFHDPPPRLVVYEAWTAVKPNSQTKHTILTTSRLMNKRHPKPPPTSAPTSAGSRVILQQKYPQSQNRHYSPVPPHLSAYTTHVQRSMSQHHFQPKKFSRGPTTRKLGDVQSLYIGGTAIL